jgi:hypothetical protein
MAAIAELIQKARASHHSRRDLRLAKSDLMRDLVATALRIGRNNSYEHRR